MTPDTVIYVPWPVETIALAREQFRDIMHDSAGPEELAAGLHGLDFLMRASTIPEPLLTFCEAVINEARMRIELMLEKEAEDRTHEENWKKLHDVFYAMRVQCRSLERMLAGFRNQDPQDLRQRIQQHVEYRKSL